MTGVVLAGGQSTRMGTDKLLLSVQGVRLVDTACNVLAAVCERVVVATRGRWIPGVYAPEIDDAEGEGPLAGIVGGLRVAATPLVAVVAADMPLASASVFERLAAAWDGEAAVAPRADDVVQPLHAVYAADARPTFDTLLRDGERSPRRALATAGARIVSADVFDPDGSAGMFWLSVNAPEDLERIAALPPSG